MKHDQCQCQESNLRHIGALTTAPYLPPPPTPTFEVCTNIVNGLFGLVE